MLLVLISLFSLSNFSLAQDLPQESVETTSPSLIQKVIKLTNQYRAERGLPPLNEHPLLTEAAQAHAQAMGTRRFFSHDSKDGSSPGDRLSDVGYQWRVYAENIAHGQTTAEQVMRSWINSPGHRANLLNRKVNEIGVGYYIGTSSRSGSIPPIYWVQDFGKR